MDYTTVMSELSDVKNTLSMLSVGLEDSYTHYHSQYLRCLWSLTKELYQAFDGGHFSYEYIKENTDRLLDCAKQIEDKMGKTI